MYSFKIIASSLEVGFTIPNRGILKEVSLSPVCFMVTFASLTYLSEATKR
jgi:hypothetical protein